MKTLILKNEIGEAPEIIRRGGLVAFPTETVYGLGGNAFDPQASAKIYAAKGRPSDNPLIVHICDLKQLDELAADIPENARKLAEKFWPGPMTLVFRKMPTVPKETTGGLDTVAVRFPVNEIARQLIEAAGVPIAAPSANTSGRPSPTIASHVIEDMNGRIDCIIDGGDCEIGVESTIVDVTGDIPALLRPGKITLEDLKQCVGEVEIDPAIIRPMKADEKPKAPGMKYKHYAPKAELKIVKGETQKVAGKINELVEEDAKCGIKSGIIATEESQHLYRSGLIKVIGTRSDEATVRHNLFAVLREFDEEDVGHIYSEAFTDLAIMNRLNKAAGYDIIEV